MILVHPVWWLAPMPAPLSPLNRWHGRLDPLGKYLGQPFSDCRIVRDCGDYGGLAAVPRNRYFRRARRRASKPGTFWLSSF
jgi:hypothetical protein